MNISPNGLLFIQQNEGLRIYKYQDVAGRWTIGYGHLILPGEEFFGPIDLDKAAELLTKDVEHVEVFLNAACPGLFQNEFDALIDFGYNLGCGALHLLLSHGLDQIPVQILKWDHAAGKVITGLHLRRLRELDLWNKDAELRNGK